MRLFKRLFYTGKGDKGVSEIEGKKIYKASLEIEAVGFLDEVNSLLGLVKTQSLPKGYRDILEQVQENLFIIQAHVGVLMMGKFTAPPFSLKKVKEIEKLIDGFEKKVKPEKGFIIAGSNEASSWLDFVRSVVRRSEVVMVKLDRKHRKKLEPAILAYLNRLSSLLYAMARHAAKTKHSAEQHPTYK